MKKPSANSNKASMFFQLYAFHDGVKYKREDTFETGRPSRKSAMIRSNPPNLQISDETRILCAWPTCKSNEIH